MLPGGVMALPYLLGQEPELRRRDIPVPRILAHGPLDRRGYGWVLERLAGTRPTVFDEALFGELMELVDRMAGAPPGPHRNDLRSWVPAVVFEDLAGWWRTAVAMGPEAAGFCRAAASLDRQPVIAWARARSRLRAR